MGSLDTTNPHYTLNTGRLYYATEHPDDTHPTVVDDLHTAVRPIATGHCYKRLPTDRAPKAERLVTPIAGVKVSCRHNPTPSNRNPQDALKYSTKPTIVDLSPPSHSRKRQRAATGSFRSAFGEKMMFTIILRAESGDLEKTRPSTPALVDWGWGGGGRQSSVPCMELT